MDEEINQPTAPSKTDAIVERLFNEFFPSTPMNRDSTSWSQAVAWKEELKKALNGA